MGTKVIYQSNITASMLILTVYCHDEKGDHSIVLWEPSTSETYITKIIVTLY